MDDDKPRHVSFEGEKIKIKMFKKNCFKIKNNFKIIYYSDSSLVRVALMIVLFVFHLSIGTLFSKIEKIRNFLTFNLQKKSIKQNK